MRTGALVKDLGALGASWTNNGFALAPDGRSVYLTLIGRRTLQIERISVATGERSVAATGEQPAISFDGRHLAYAAGGLYSSVLAVRDLASGFERRINLHSLLGPSYELLNSSISWTGDGADVVVLAAHVAMTDASPGGSTATGASSADVRSCSAHAETLCLVEVRVGRSRSLAAHRVTAAVVNRGVSSLAGDPSRSRAVFLVRSIGFGSALYRLSLGKRGTAVTRVVSLPKGLPVAVGPTATDILYLNVGSHQPCGGLTSGPVISRDGESSFRTYGFRPPVGEGPSSTSLDGGMPGYLAGPGSAQVKRVADRLELPGDVVALSLRTHRASTRHSSRDP